MAKFVLTLNSHSLSSFQECESKHLYSHVLGIEGLGSKVKMDQGTLYARYLETYYYNKIKGSKFSREKYLLNPIAWTRRISKRLGYNSQESFKLFSAMREYVEHYKKENWIPLAAERGFSKILYEDDENLFIYEGRPDLVALSDPINKDLLITDHKTQGRTSSFYAHNNQAYGYIWNYAAQYFVYNYIVLNKVTDFRREVFKYHPNQIEQWVNETTEWFFRVKYALQKKSFLKSWQCQGQWGNCPFTLICERPKEEDKLIVIRAQYLKRKVYRSW